MTARRGAVEAVLAAGALAAAALLTLARRLDQEVMT